MKEIVWTIGQYDMVVTLEAPDDASASSFALWIGSAGNIRGQTLRAHSRDEMNAILSKGVLSTARGVRRRPAPALRRR